MGTWIDDISDPKLRACYRVVGNQPRWALRNMVKALETFPYARTQEEDRLLSAARYVLRHSGKKG